MCFYKKSVDREEYARPRAWLAMANLAGGLDSTAIELKTAHLRVGEKQNIALLAGVNATEQIVTCLLLRRMGEKSTKYY